MQIVRPLCAETFSFRGTLSAVSLALLSCGGFHYTTGASSQTQCTQSAPTWIGQSPIIFHSRRETSPNRPTTVYAHNTIMSRTGAEYHRHLQSISSTVWQQYDEALLSINTSALTSPHYATCLATIHTLLGYLPLIAQHLAWAQYAQISSCPLNKQSYSDISLSEFCTIDIDPQINGYKINQSIDQQDYV